MMKPKQSKLPVKHVPKRTCIACRKTGTKREFIRLVCTPESEVEIDLTGRKAGRGSYLCINRKCWELALSTGGIERALRIKLTSQNREKLVNYEKGLDNTNS
jgi:uncharacterized protein